jgi:hypothetical protein
MSRKRSRRKPPVDKRTPDVPKEKHPLLEFLAEEFERVRKPRIYPFPIDKATGAISLPSDTVHELFHLVKEGRKIDAVKRVTELTGAGLRQAKDYVDRLEQRR